jgi:hypothetical protein
MTRIRITYTVLFVLMVFGVFSQTANFNNGWITPGQKYFKIKVAVDGLYKLDSASLAAAGVPIGTIDPHHIQLFQKGKELYPYIAGEADDTLNARDYILFYAEKNKGIDDSDLYSIYPSAPFLTNPYYSVINDTSAVFFTWNSSTNNKRLTLNTDTNYTAYPNPAPYYIRDVFCPSLLSLGAGYAPGPYNIVNQNDPRYLTGEGVASYTYLYQNGNSGGNANVFSYSFNTSSVATSAPFSPYVTVCFSGGNDIAFTSPDHIIQVDYQGATGTQILGTYSVDAYGSRRLTYALNPGSFSTGSGANTTIDITSLTNPAASASGTTIDNYINVNYMRFVYPQTFNLLGQSQEKMYIPDDITGQLKSHLELSNFNNNGTQGILIDTINRMISFLSATNPQVLVPNTGSTKFCFLSSWSQVDSTLNIKPVNGTSVFVDYMQQNLDSAYLIISHPKLMTAAADYKTYRSSITGGHYNVVLASIEDLYDQFAYGVELHPMAIKNFCAYLINNASTNHIAPPSNLFLIGKGTHAMDASYYYNSYASVAASLCLVPSFGNPSSDNMLTVGLPGSSFFPEPAIPTGRLAAQSDQDVTNYFDKVQLYEAQSADSIWRKRALHFIGGATPGDQASFNGYMTGLKQVYLDTLIGGNVFSFYKTSTAPISINTNDSVTELINQGVSLMTFFGHGSATGFDQNIDAPGTYNNAPRIPFILANSCLTGDIFDYNQTTSSEQWILAPNNKGSIGFIATTAEGVALELYEYSLELYKQFSYKNYGQPYGYCMKNSIHNLMLNFLNNPGLTDSLLMESCQEMTLHGDPAIKANTVPKPDYTLTNADVIFDTKTYPTDSIGIKIVMTNNAKAIHAYYSVRVQRMFPNGDTTTIYKTVKAPLYKDTLSFFIFENYTRAVGINNFSVYLDAGHQIPETDENNNATIGNIPLFIQGADIEPIWPYEFAIVPNTNTITLQASTADPFYPTHSYRFQVDTSAFFTSMFVNTTVNAPGGVVSLPNVSLLGVDSMVYYWRVAKDSTVPNWKGSSFQVIKSKYGWEQAHFYQFRGDAYQYVKWDSAHWGFDFANNVNTVQVQTALIPSTNPPIPPGSHVFTDVQFYLNNLLVQNFSCGLDGWNIGIFNPISGNLVPSDTATGVNGIGWWLGPNGNCMCDNYGVTRYTYDFGTENQCPANYPPNTALAFDWRPKLTALLDTLKPGTPIIAYTTKADYDPYFHTFPLDNSGPATALKTAFQSIGSSQIMNLNDTTSMIIFGKKGMSPGQAHEVLSTNEYELITLVDTLDQHFKSGYIASEIIGPAQHSDTAWKSLHWRYKSYDPNPNADSIVIQVIGIDSNGVKTTVAVLNSTELDVTNLYNYGGNNNISAKKYPYLQLIAYEADNTYHTPPQLKRWQVMYDPVPEAALSPASGFTVAASTVSEGQAFQARIPIKNISAFPFTDSLLISYSIEDANRTMHQLPFKMKRKPFLPDSVLYDTVNVSTLGYGGSNILWIDVNPLNNKKHQLEEYHFNNTAQIAFNVTKDKINPILDVTFDGTHILNGDIVSSKPDVLISLKDENKFLALNDTGNFALYTTTANSSTQQRIYFNNPQVQFTPAVLPNNSCKINYKPTLAQDGLYSLDVKATDRSSNISGQTDYKIQYEVINKPMITEVLNYPNPFSTSTKFVFTITGNEVPQTFKIQIMTITGKIIKEITREELGYIHIGRNITEYAWDGTDMYGGKLANGVYFYHIVTRLNGSEVEHMNTSADEYFKKGIGKMVIMR